MIEHTVIHQSCTMGELLMRAVARGGERTAFVVEGKPCSYSTFGQRLSQFVQALAAFGVVRGTGVACLAGNTLEAYLVSAACHLLGARITNLHPMGSADDHAFIVDHSEAGVVVFDPIHHGDRLSELTARCTRSPRCLALGASDVAPDLCASAAEQVPVPLVNVAEADDACMIVYTGGTTGKPKGVVHTHRSFVAVMMAELAEWEWPDRPVFLAITPISHGAGPCLPPVLLRGGTVVLETGFSPAKFLDLVDRYQISATFLVPTMVYKLLDHLGDAGGLPRSSLRLVVYGAAPMAPARMLEALQVFGPVFMQLYGQSEAPNCLTVLRRVDHDPARPERLSSCGLPIASNCIALLDAQGEQVPQGSTGEICVRGPLVMAGYWNDPAETQKAFRHGWLHTGDLARADAQGYLYIVGRSKDMIITGGFNVYPAEVEEVVGDHPAVSAVAVIGIPDPTWGEAVKAVVMLRSGCAVTAEEIIARVRAAKGPIHAPKSVEFVHDIPLTGLGKPDKKLLRERFGEARG